MTRVLELLGIAALALGAAAASAQEVTAPIATDERERLHVLYDPDDQSVTRRMVAVFDPHPDLNLQFTWNPAPGNWPGIDPATGRATGQGTVSWRVSGAARYDTRAVHHSYTGGMRDGRFHGQGVLRYRDGTIIDGIWQDGALMGQATLRDSAGNRYEGSFRAGLAEGHGTWFAREGWVYSGGFAAGRPHGAGEMRQPGGKSFAILHEAGREIGSDRPVQMPDPMVGGLLPAQSGGMAGRTELAVTVDARIAFEQLDSLPYAHWTDASGTVIYPDNEEMIALWNGGGPIDHLFFMYDEAVLWDDSYAAVRADLRSTDGSRVELRELALEFSESYPHLKPMLRLREHLGCLPFRPTFTLENLGWGAVEDAVAEIRFTHPERRWTETFDNGRPIPLSAPQMLPIPGFDLGTDVEMRTVLAAMGVDLRALERPFFDCSRHDSAEACLPDVLSSIDFGALAPHVAAGGVEFNTYNPANAGAYRPDGAFLFNTLVTGVIRYTWANHLGERIPVEEPFNAEISLMIAERREISLAEAGGGGAFAVAAPEFHSVDLPVRASNYDFTIRPTGNPMLASFAGRYRMRAPQSSVHEFKAVARFGDGSERRSLPVTLYFMKPRLDGYQSRATPAKCVMPPVFDPNDLFVQGG